MSNVVLIDANNLFHRTYSKFAKFSHQGKGTGGIFGTLNSLRALMEDLRPDIMEVIWDGSRSAHRLEIHPGYKAGRKLHTPQESKEFDRQKLITRRAIYYLGITQIVHPEMEADDYIAWRARKYNKKGNKVYIVSSDKDFHQCISQRVMIWDDMRKVMLTKENLLALKGYHPHQCVDYLCLVGDKGDNIVGYPGMGEVRTKTFLRDHSSIKAFLENYKAQFMFLERDQLKKIYHRNGKLINLKLFYVLFLQGKINIGFYKKKSRPVFNEEKFIDLCLNYNFKTLHKKNHLDIYRKWHELRSTNGE